MRFYDSRSVLPFAQRKMRRHFISAHTATNQNNRKERYYVEKT